MELTKDPKTVQLRTEMYAKLREAETAAHAYFAQCEVGDERSWAAEIYDIIRTAPRAAKDNL